MTRAGVHAAGGGPGELRCEHLPGRVHRTGAVRSRDAFILVAWWCSSSWDWRSTRSPSSPCRCRLIGAFFIMQLFGLSINLITLFALVLAIGIVVDNARHLVEGRACQDARQPDLTPYRR